MFTEREGSCIRKKMVKGKTKVTVADIVGEFY